MKFPSQLGATVAFVVVAATTTKTVSGNLASPFPFEETNADGTPTGEMYIHGGPGESWFEDKQGFTICPVDEQPTRRSRRFLGVLDWFTGGTSEEDLASSDPERTFYYCDQDENGNAVPRTDLKVGESDPQASGLPAHIEITSDQLEAQCGPYCQLDENGRRLGEEEIDGSHRKLQGTLKNLVVLMRFSDHATRDLPSVGEVDDLMSADSPTTSCPTGSVKQVFLENSNGRLILDSTVYQWVTLDPLYTETYCANGRSGLDARVHECIANALDQVEAGGLDFRDFDQDSDGRIDAITFLHSGYGAEWNGAPNRIWSHKWVLYSINDGGGSGWTSNTGVSVYTYHISPSLWGTSGNAIGRIGVIAHETGHFLGLPDLYDTDGGGQGLNSWSLMANSWGFDGSQLYPPLMDPWCKIQLGWVTPTVLTETSRSIEIKPSYTEDDYYVIQKGFPQGEYLVIENRRRVGYDSQIPREGLMIYHIDDSASFNREGFPGQFNWPQNGNHYRVALLQADGAYNLERGRGGDSGDVFHGGSGGVSSLGPGPNVYPNTDSYKFGNIVQTRVTIENISPAGEMMTFDFLDGDDAVEGAPTQAPTTEGPHEISVRVTHDRYPEETSWNLVNVAGGGVLARQNAGEVTTDNTVVVETIRVYPGTFRFDISDVYNDGICCTYGIGSFEIKVDGMVVYASDGSFGQSDSTTFEVGGAIIDTSAPTGQSSPAPTPIPTVQPTGPPTVFPTVSPSTSPTFPAPTAPPTVTPTDRPTTLATTNAPTSQPSSVFTDAPVPTSTATPVSTSSAAPTTISTMSPSAEETSTEELHLVEIEVIHDNYPRETSWTFTESNGSNEILASQARNSVVTNGHVANVALLVSSGEYLFEIKDSAWDGICCAWGNGSYTVKVDGTVVSTGGEFGSSKIESVSVGSTEPPTTDLTTVKIQVKHDNYASETGWELLNAATNAVLARQLKGTVFNRGQIITKTVLVPAGDYTFHITDSFSDGICCSYGEGLYEVTVGNTVVASGGDFGAESFDSFTVDGP